MTTAHQNPEPLLFTLQDVYDARPCLSGWTKLLASLGCEGVSDARCISDTVDKFDPEKKISLGNVAESNGAADAMWCIRVLDWSDVSVRRRVIAGVILPAVRRASRHTTDERVMRCTGAMQKWCDGDDSVDLLNAYAAEAAHAYAAAAEAATAEAAAAEAAAAEAAAAEAAERDTQKVDIITAFPPEATQ